MQKDVLVAESIVAPHPEALAKPETLREETAVAVDVTVEGDEPVEREDGELTESSPIVSDGLATDAATDIGSYVETQASESEGWLRYVLPVEGFAIEMPETWVATPLPLDERHGIAGSSPDGMWSCGVLRLSNPGSLFAAAESEVGRVRLEETLVDEEIGFVSEALPSGDAIRIDYTLFDDAGSLRDNHVYLVGRGPVGEVGLSYRISCSGPSDGSDGFEAFTTLMVVRSFEMLGVERAP